MENDAKSLCLNDVVIQRRDCDGFINLTLLCQAGGKKFNHWVRNVKSQKFLDVLACMLQMNTTQLVCVVQGGDSKLQGSWGHPQVAINIALWISPLFCAKVTQWLISFHELKHINVFETIKKSIQSENLDKTTAGYIYALTSDVLCNNIHKIGKTKHDANYLKSDRYKTPYGDRVKVLLHKYVSDRHTAENILKSKLNVHAINASGELIRCDFGIIQKSFDEID